MKALQQQTTLQGLRARYKQCKNYQEQLAFMKDPDTSSVLDVDV